MSSGLSQTMKLPASDSAQRNDFSQTHWTTVLHAQGVSPSADEALNKLCRRYWPPVYAFIRRRWNQHSPPKAEDLTQEFFSEFIRKFPNLDIDPRKGKFRTYLLACLTRFLCKDWERSPSHYEVVIPPGDLEKAATSGLWQGSTDCTPERSFDVAWAVTLVGRALDSLREEYIGADKTALHARLLPLLSDRSVDGAYAELAAELQMSEGALRVAAHQFRRRFGQLLRSEVARTVQRLEDTDEELRYLLSLWGVNGPSPVIGS
jgi:DNA-directed RNA polymerase specialized sigma24 family protein